MTQTWVYALVVIAIGHFLATVALYYYLAMRDRGGAEEDVEPPSITDPGSDSPRSPSVSGHEFVVCSECETPNEPGYRYCRQCVSPLASVTDRNRNDHGPDAPWIR